MKTKIINKTKDSVKKAVTDTLKELAKRKDKSGLYAYALLLDTFADLLNN